METEIIKTIGIIIGFSTSLVSIIKVFIESSKAKKIKAELEITKADAKEALLIAKGNIEINTKAMISDARKHIENITIQRVHYKAKNPNLDLDIFDDLHFSSTEDLLNAYEKACMLYLDGKIDKERFKKEYNVEIRNLFEKSKHIAEKYLEKKSSSFKALIKVYDEWNNLEK